MSSYVIEKENFMRVAGLLSELNKRDNFRATESGLWIGEFTQEGRWHLLEEEDFIKLFKTFYNANVLSVERQYHEPITKEDYKEDNALLSSSEQSAFNIGKMVAHWGLMYRDVLQVAVKSLSNFIDTASYQIEDLELNDYVISFLNKAMVKLYQVAYHFDLEAHSRATRENGEYWSDFDLKECIKAINWHGQTVANVC